MRRSITCHICGRSFGAASIAIHTAQCARRWEDQEELESPSQRPTSPSQRPTSPSQRPTSPQGFLNWAADADIDADAAESDADLNVLALRRSFVSSRDSKRVSGHVSDDSLESLAVGNSREVIAVSSFREVIEERHVSAVESAPVESPRSKVLACNICGREFSAASLAIHVAQCEKKWFDQEEQKPLSERCPLPPVSEQGPAVNVETHAQDAGFCVHCGRMFLREHLEKHQRSCDSVHGNVLNPRSPQSSSIPQGNTSGSHSARGRLRGPDSGLRITPRTTIIPRTTSEAIDAKQTCQGLACHICGRFFGPASIKIHMVQCAKNGEAKECLKKPGVERQPVPLYPVEDTDCDMNDSWAYEVAAHASEMANRVPCSWCRHMFHPDQLEDHQRSCPANALNNRLVPVLEDGVGTRCRVPSIVVETSGPLNLHSVVCYICGREFGAAAIGIHVPQCKRKWEAREALKPAQQRRKLPAAPQKKVGISKEEYNKIAVKTWSDQAMQPCPHCGRTFLPDILAIHSRSCWRREGVAASPERRHESPLELVHSETGRQDSELGRQSADIADLANPGAKQVRCHICNQEFGKDAIRFHTSQCALRREAQVAGDCGAIGRARPSDLRLSSKEMALQTQVSTQDMRSGSKEAVQQTQIRSSSGSTRETGNPTRALASTSRPISIWAGDGPAPVSTSRPRTNSADLCRSTSADSNPESPVARERSAHIPVEFIAPARSELSMSMTPSQKLMTMSYESSSSRRDISRKRTVECHICGREFGSAAIDIHVPQCVKSWEAREALKPPAERRQAPVAPIRLAEMSQDDFNAATANQRHEVKLPCEHCGRTFFPDRLVAHLRICNSKMKPKAWKDLGN